MLRFAIGTAVGLGLGLGITAYLSQDLIRSWEWLAAANWLLITPWTAIVVVAGILHARRPRRALRRACERSLGAWLAGLITAVVTLGLAVVGLAFLDRWLPDAVIAAAAGVIASLLVVHFLPLAPTGLCARCGYDIHASLAFGRCPECGTPIAGGP